MFGNERNILLISEEAIRRIVADEVTRALDGACKEVREQASGTYSRTEVEKLLKCSPPTLRSLVKAGKLHPSKIKGKVLFHRLEVETFIGGNIIG